MWARDTRDSVRRRFAGKALVGAFAALGGFALLGLAAPAAQAGVLRWSGTVDDTATIRLSGRDIRTDSNMRGVQAERRDLRGALPRERTYLTVRQENGRGRVDVIEQPNARNNYTAVVRVRDAQAGGDRYAFTLQWDERGGGRRDRDRDRDSRDRDDRGGWNGPGRGW